MLKIQSLHQSLGVTLLEILLVLGISASIILMSVRYYGSATSSLQANTTLEQIQAITATVDNYSTGLTYSNVSNATIKALMPQESLKTAWGTEISLTSIGPTAYAVSFPGLPAAVCPLVQSKLNTNLHYHIQSACSTAATNFTYTYFSNA